MSSFGLGLLGAAVGAGKTLSNEYENINEEKRVMRREGRVNDFAIEAELRREEAAKRSEARAIQNKRKTGIIDNQLKMQLTVTEDSYARDQLAKGTDVITLRKNIEEQRTLRMHKDKQPIDIETAKTKAQNTADIGIVTDKTKKENAAEIDLKDDQKRRVLDLDINRSERKTDVDLVGLTPAEAQRGFKRAISGVTGFESLKEAVGDRVPLSKKLDKGNITLSEIYGDPEDRAQYRAEVIFGLAENEKTQLDLDAKGKKINDPKILEDRAASIASQVDAVMTQLDSGMQRLESKPGSAWKEQLSATGSLDKAMLDLEKMSKDRVKDKLGDVPDETFEAMWPHYIRSFRNYIRGN